MKKIITIILALALVFALAACGGGEDNSTSSDVVTSGAFENKGPEESTITRDEESKKTDGGGTSGGGSTADSSSSASSSNAVSEQSQSNGGSTVDNRGQFDAPKAGDTVAIINVKDYGEIRVCFFAGEAPKAVENFLTHAKNGYYNGLPFHRIMKDFMIQGGDPKGNGTGGESIWKTGFKVEISNNLRHYNGALSMARSSALDSQGSQFFIVHDSKKTSRNSNEWKSVETQAKASARQNGIPAVTFPQDVRDNYNKYGGSPHLDGSYTVFGQVYQGLDVVNKIANTRVSGETPVKKPVIEKITVEAIK